MNTYYQQFYFYEQEGYQVDTVKFVVPSSVSVEEFNIAVERAKQAFNPEDYNDRIDMAYDMAASIAEQLCGLYEYIDINDVIEIEW